MKTLIARALAVLLPHRGHRTPNAGLVSYLLPERRLHWNGEQATASKTIIPRVLGGILAGVLTLIIASAPSAFGGTWTPLVQTAPGSIGLMMLLSDGTVMAKSFDGGGDGYGNTWYKLTPDSTGSYVNGTWTALTPMNYTRLYGASQMLKDGRVFVAGGEYGTGKTTAETYDPVANVWTLAPASGHTFSDSNSEILPDGRVLVGPVEALQTGTVIFDPVANAWDAGATTLGSYNESAWVKLPDNSILYVNKGSTSAERYIPATNTWIADAAVPVSLYDLYGDECGPGMLLPNGKVIFFGATGHTAIYTPSGSTANGTWVAGPDFPNGQGQPDAPCAMMPNGNILLAVCPIPISSGNVFQPPTTFYEYNYTTNSFTSVPTPTGGTMNYASYLGTMLTLPDGTVLYSNFGSQIYSYQGGGTPLAAGQPTIASITENSDASYHLTGTQLNGISEGSCYGDDNQNATNYPIVRLTSGGTVYYCRTYNWSSTSVATGGAPVTTEFTVPASLPVGSYSLVVVANGIASNPFAFTYALPPLAITPAGGLTAAGGIGGPFTPSSVVYTLTNNGSSPLNWTAASTQGWNTISSAGGTLAAGANATVTVSVNAAANSLAIGSYADTVTFTNVTAGTAVTRPVALTVSHDYFTELISTGMDLANQSWLFTPNASGNYYSIRRTASVTSFSTNPAGGTALALTDDSNVQVTPAGGAQVKLYGASYSSFYVGSNGYVTFTGGDTTYSQTLAAHFNQPRISPLFVDLNPGTGGTVGWQQFTDRIVVTWQAVPNYSLSDSNSFQVEMFLDGRIRITCLGIGSSAGLIGLSQGLGTPADYAASDMDTYPAAALSNVADLAALTLSAGALSPAFASGTTGYTATVPNATASLTVTPTAADSVEGVKVNGTTLTSGSASAAIGLVAGSNTISTLVTAQDGVTTKTYTVVVTRLGLPVVTTLAATSITSTGAIVNGSVNAANGSTDVSFDYGLTNAYGTNVAGTPATVTGSTATAVSAALTGLSPLTTYHFRVNGTSASGTANGTDLSFTTPTVAANWRLAYFGSTANTGDAADTADPYHKGILNIEVFAFMGPNQDPATATVAQLPQLQKIGGSLVYTFAQPAGVSGITYGAQWTSSLGPASWHGLTDTGTNGVHTFSLPISGSTPRYLRLTLTEQ